MDIEQKSVAVVLRIDDVHAILENFNHKTDLVFLPVTFEVFVHLKKLNCNVVNPSQFFTNEDHVRCLLCLEQFEYIFDEKRKILIDIFQFDAVFKEFKKNYLFNISYVLFFLITLSNLAKKNCRVIFVDQTVISSQPNLMSDLLFSSIAKKLFDNSKFDNWHTIPDISCLSEGSLKTYEIVGIKRAKRPDVILHAFGYGIHKFLKHLHKDSWPEIRYLSLVEFDESIAVNLKRLAVYVKRFLFYRSKPLIVKSFGTGVKAPVVSLPKFGFVFEGVDLEEILTAKVRNTLPYYLNQIKLFEIVGSFYKTNKPDLTLAWSSVGLSDNIGFLGKTYGKESLCISHGTVCCPTGKFDYIYRKFIADSVFLNQFKSVAIQSPLAEQFFESNNVTSVPIFTGNILFARSGKSKFNLFGRKRRFKIVHAVTLKGIGNLQFLGVQLFDEMFSEISEIHSRLDQQYEFVVKIHPQFYHLIQNLKYLLPGIKFSTKAIEAELVDANVLISFSSTSIEDSLNCGVPVILFDKVKRYKHCAAQNVVNNLELNSPPVFYTQSLDDLISFLPKICSIDRGLLNFSGYTFGVDYNKNISKYLSSIKSGGK